MENNIGDLGTVLGSNCRLTAKILGTFQIVRGTEVMDARQLGGPKPRQILEILLMHLGTPVSKSMLIELLWDGDEPVAAVSTLESYVSVLRRSLQPGQGKTGVLRTVTGGYLLDQELVDLDLGQFEALLYRAEHCEPQQSYLLLCEALAMATEPLLGSELLPEWAEAERRLHTARVATAMVRAAQTGLELGMASESMNWARLVLETDPLNEPAWTCLILGAEKLGNPLAGLQAYEDCRRVMGRELGCSPGLALQDAQARMLRDTSAANDDFGHVISALLAIQQSIGGQQNQGLPSESVPATDPALVLRAAGTIISGYLQRAMLRVAA